MIDHLIKLVPELEGCRFLTADDGRLFVFPIKPLSRKVRQHVASAWGKLHQGRSIKATNWKFEVLK